MYNVAVQCQCVALLVLGSHWCAKMAVEPCGNTEQNVAFELDSWLKQNGITDSTAIKLSREEVNTRDALASLSEADITDLKLPIGQRSLLRQAVCKLRQPVPA